MENMGKWPSGHRKTEILGHRLAAEKLCSLDGGTGDMISANLEIIWEMSAEGFAGSLRAPEPAKGRERRV